MEGADCGLQSEGPVVKLDAFARHHRANCIHQECLHVVAYIVVEAEGALDPSKDGVRPLPSQLANAKDGENEKDWTDTDQMQQIQARGGHEIVLRRKSELVEADWHLCVWSWEVENVLSDEIGQTLIL